MNMLRIIHKSENENNGMHIILLTSVITQYRQKTDVNTYIL